MRMVMPQDINDHHAERLGIRATVNHVQKDEGRGRHVQHVDTFAVRLVAPHDRAWLRGEVITHWQEA